MPFLYLRLPGAGSLCPCRGRGCDVPNDSTWKMTYVDSAPWPKTPQVVTMASKVAVGCGTACPLPERSSSQRNQSSAGSGQAVAHGRYMAPTDRCWHNTEPAFRARCAVQARSRRLVMLLRLVWRSPPGHCAVSASGLQIDGDHPPSVVLPWSDRPAATNAGIRTTSLST